MLSYPRTPRARVPGAPRAASLPGCSRVSGQLAQEQCHTVPVWDSIKYIIRNACAQPTRKEEERRGHLAPHFLRGLTPSKQPPESHRGHGGWRACYRNISSRQIAEAPCVSFLPLWQPHKAASDKTKRHPWAHSRAARQGGQHKVLSPPRSGPAHPGLQLITL